MISYAGVRIGINSHYFITAHKKEDNNSKRTDRIMNCSFLSKIKVREGYAWVWEN